MAGQLTDTGHNSRGWSHCAYLPGGGLADLKLVAISLRQTSPACGHHFISNNREGTNPLESTLVEEIPPHSKKRRIPHYARRRCRAGETNESGNECLYEAPSKYPDDFFGLQMTSASSSISRDLKKHKDRSSWQLVRPMGESGPLPLSATPGPRGI